MKHKKKNIDFFLFSVVKHEIVGVIGETVALPCNCSPAWPADGPHFVWYKDRSTLPIYRWELFCYQAISILLSCPSCRKSILELLERILLIFFLVSTCGPALAGANTGRTRESWLGEVTSTTRRPRTPAAPPSTSTRWWRGTAASTGAGWTTRPRPPGTPGSSSS